MALGGLFKGTWGTRCGHPRNRQPSSDGCWFARLEKTHCTFGKWIEGEAAQECHLQAWPVFWETLAAFAELSLQKSVVRCVFDASWHCLAHQWAACATRTTGNRTEKNKPEVRLCCQLCGPNIVSDALAGSPWRLRPLPLTRGSRIPHFSFFLKAAKTLRHHGYLQPFGFSLAQIALQIYSTVQYHSAIVTVAKITCSPLPAKQPVANVLKAVLAYWFGGFLMVSSFPNPTCFLS